MQKPLAFLFCKSCHSPRLELYVTKQALGAICLECRKQVFEIIDFNKFLKTTLFQTNYRPETDIKVN